MKSGKISKSKAVSFTKQDIEMDANALMATGLFRSVRPITPPADAGSNPAFFFSKDKNVVPSQTQAEEEEDCSLSQALPIRSIDFVVEPLNCPRVTGISLDASGLESSIAQEIEGLGKR